MRTWLLCLQPWLLSLRWGGAVQGAVKLCAVVKRNHQLGYQPGRCGKIMQNLWATLGLQKVVTVLTMQAILTKFHYFV